MRRQVQLGSAAEEDEEEEKDAESSRSRGGRNHCCSLLLLLTWLLPRQEVRQGKKEPVEQSYLGRSEAVGGPVGGGSLSSWEEPEVKKKEDGEPDNFSSADEAQSKLKEPEDNKN